MQTFRDPTGLAQEKVVPAVASMTGGRSRHPSLSDQVWTFTSATPSNDPLPPYTNLSTLFQYHLFSTFP